MILHNITNKIKTCSQIIKNKYKDMQLKTYDISFDDKTYKQWKYLDNIEG
jgi:hypothetical protein